MGTELYLDTARLGLMCPGARLAEQEFGWLVSRLGSSLYLERFLIHGFETLPDRYRRRVPYLACWPGVVGFRQALHTFVGQPEACPTHFFAQSSSVIRLAVDCLFDGGRRVLATDLGWPPYTATLHDAALARGKSLHVVTLKDQILHNRIDEDSLVDRIVEAYEQRGCDGIFLSDISYLGVKLPIEKVLGRLGEACRFSVIDGAQAFNHRPVDLSRLNCDLYLAGTQKWFRSYHPLRMAFVGRQHNLEWIEQVATAMEDSRDALFGFCRSAEGRAPAAYGETVNVGALMTAAGALRHMTSRPATRLILWKRLTENATALAGWLAGSSYIPVVRSRSLQSGILLLRDAHSADDSQPVERSALAENGLVASAFTGGLLRLSMPTVAFSLHQMSTITRALHQLESCIHRKPRSAKICPGNGATNLEKNKAVSPCFHTEITQQATM